MYCYQTMHLVSFLYGVEFIGISNCEIPYTIVLQYVLSENVYES